MPHITRRTIASIETTGKVYFIRDDNPRGFALKITAKGKASYIVEARVRGGRVVRHTIGDVDHIDLDDARSEARGKLHRLKKGVDVSKERKATPPAPDSLSDVFDQYLSVRTNLRETTKSDYRKIMSNCFSDLLPMDVKHITKEDIARKHRELSARSSEAYTSKALRTLKAVLNSSGLVVNPVGQFQKSSGTATTSKARTRYLLAHEIGLILEHSRQDESAIPYEDTDPVFCELLTFFLLTGLRLNEALFIRKSDVDPAKGTIIIPRTKSGRPHEIPLVGILKNIVEGRMREAGSTDRLWPYSPSSYRTLFDKTRKAFDFKEPWTTHDLRRTFAEHCALIGVPESVISACLNHAPVGVTARHYTGGGLAKLQMMRDTYEALQAQYQRYWVGMPDLKLKPGDESLPLHEIF